jgi:hypothetical protein
MTIGFHLRGGDHFFPSLPKPSLIQEQDAHCVSCFQVLNTASFGTPHPFIGIKNLEICLTFAGLFFILFQVFFLFPRHLYRENDSVNSVFSTGITGRIRSRFNLLRISGDTKKEYLQRPFYRLNGCWRYMNVIELEHKNLPIH